MRNIKPQDIITKLDEYIINQDGLKRAVALAIRDKYRYSKIADSEEIKEDIIPQNIIIKGHSGSGKTATIRKLASLYDAPFIKTDATQYTQQGIVGRSVTDIINDLVSAALSYERRVLEKSPEVDEAVLEQIVQHFSQGSMPANMEAHLRNEIENGNKDNDQISITTVEYKPDPTLGAIKKFIKTKNMSVKQAKDFLRKQVIQEKLEDPELLNQAIKNAEEHGIVFIDEIDKTIRNDNMQGSPIEMVQKELLTMVEGTKLVTKFGEVDTTNILFIVGGAFSEAKVSDLTPEFQGRFPVRIEMEDLTEEALRAILANSKSSILKQVTALLKIDGVDLKWEDAAIDAIAHFCYEMNRVVENTGARRLNSSINILLEDISLQAGNGTLSGEFIITEELVKSKLVVEQLSDSGIM